MYARKTTTHRWFLLALTCILLVGAGLRLRILGQDVRFHSDESFFNTFAVNAAVHGKWMLGGPLDKSPLTIYANAISLHFVGVHINVDSERDVDVRVGEFAARVPNTFASIVLIALITRLTYDLSRKSSASLLAALLAMLSPFLLVFSPSSFTDVFMLMLMVAALLATVRGAFLWAGVWLALSIWSKQQGIYYLPLLLAVMALHGTLNWHNLRRLSLTLVLGIALFVLWDALRPGESIFVLASANNNPGRLFVGVDEWWPRLSEWLGYLGWGLGPALVTAAFVLLGVIGLCKDLSRLELLLWGYCAAFFIGHWLVAFNTYDRYLLPIIPLLIVLVAIGISQLTGRGWLALKVAFIIPLLITAIIASGWGINLGRDSYPLDREGEWIALAEYLNAKPYETIVYDRWTGWEMGYYLGPWTDKRRVFYPTPTMLAEGALSHPDPHPRYLIMPRDEWDLPWVTSLMSVGFDVRADYTTPMFIVYELTRPS